MTSDNIIHLTRILRWNRAVRAYNARLAPRPLTFLSICSGIEAASVAWNPLGWQAVGFAEIEKFPSAVLAHHYPDVRNYGDFTTINTRTLGRVDILCGGTPCQAFSVAGARKSLDDARGNLTLAFVDLAHEIQPRNVVWENVPGVLSTKDNAFGCFLAGLVGASEPFIPTEPRPADGKSNRHWGWSAKERCHYIKWPRYGLVTGPKGRAAWAIKDAQYFSLAQRRERVIVVADFGNGADPAAVLFEPEGVHRDSPPSRETGQGVAAAVAPSLTASGRGVERTGDPRGQDPVVAVFAPPIARCVATREGSSQDYESTTMVAQQVYSIMPQNSGKDYKARPVDVAQPVMAAGQNHGNQGGDVVCVTGPISHALKAEGADASEDGTGRGTPIIAFSAKDYGADASTELAPTLRAGGHTSSHANAGVMPAIAYALNSHAGCADGEVTNNSHASGGPVGMGVSEELAYSLRAGRTQSVAQTVALRGREGGGTAELGGDLANALRASSGGGDKPHVLTSAVRRLTPRECERLQGFQFRCAPDHPGAWQDEVGRWWSPDYTAVPYGNVSQAKLDADYLKYLARGNPKNLTRKQVAGLAADGPRYKALGNSWAVPLFTWLGKRIAERMPR